jgi:hypothetical protein
MATLRLLRPTAIDRAQYPIIVSSLLALEPPCHPLLCNPALRQIEVPERTRPYLLEDIHEMGVLFVGLILPLLQEVIWADNCFVLGELFGLAFVEVYHILRMVIIDLLYAIRPSRVGARCKDSRNGRPRAGPT